MTQNAHNLEQVLSSVHVLCLEKHIVENRTIGKSIIKITIPEEKKMERKSLGGNPFDTTQEYQILRNEILQYAQEYQTIRNMMYVSTIAILGINRVEFENALLFLLPLIIILPSYVIFYDYWKSVAVASIYIQKFLESEENCPFHWETRHRKFGKELSANVRFGKINPKWWGMHCQQLPYFTCSAMCFVLYIVQLVSDRRNMTENIFDLYIWTGVLVAIVSLMIFGVLFNVNNSIIDHLWQKIKDNEK